MNQPFKLVLVWTLFLVTASCSGPLENPAGEQSIVINTFNQAWNTGELGLLDQTVHETYLKQEGNQQINGVDELKEYVRGFRESMPDVRITYLEEVHDQDKTAVRFTLEGTPLESGIYFKAQGMVLFRFKDGKIIEDYGVFDQLSALQQQGFALVPPANE